MSEINLVNQPQSLVDLFMVKMSEGSGNLNQLLAFMSLSNTMASLNIINGSEQKFLGSGTLDTLLRGGESQGLQPILNMLGQGGGKPNLTDLMGMLGGALGQQGQGKLNPQMLLSLLSLLSQIEPKKKITPVEEKQEEKEEEKEREDSKEKRHHERR